MVNIACNSVKMVAPCNSKLEINACCFTVLHNVAECQILGSNQAIHRQFHRAIQTHGLTFMISLYVFR